MTEDILADLKSWQNRLVFERDRRPAEAEAIQDEIELLGRAIAEIKRLGKAAK